MVSKSCVLQSIATSAPKSFINSMFVELLVAAAFLSFIIANSKDFSKKQLEQIVAACLKFGISGYEGVLERK